MCSQNYMAICCLAFDEVVVFNMLKWKVWSDGANTGKFMNSLQ